MSVAPFLNDGADEAAQFMGRELQLRGRVVERFDPPPNRLCPRDPEVLRVPVVLLLDPLETLTFYLSVMQSRFPGMVFDLPRAGAGKLPPEMFRFDARGAWPTSGFCFWAHVKLDAYTRMAPLLVPVTPHPFVGFAVLSALVCYPEYARRIVTRPETGLWIPGIRTARIRGVPEWDTRAMERMGNMLRLGRERFRPTKGLLLTHAPGDMMDGHYRVPAILTR